MTFLLTILVVAAIVVIVKIIEYVLRKPYINGITKEKYVFITGCDMGFGNQLTKQLDLKGVHVIATCLTEKGRSDLDADTSGRVTTFLLDVTDHGSVANAFEEVKKIIPNNVALWGVVNNAGVFNDCGNVEWSRREDYEKIMAVNFFGLVDVTLTFLPLLKKSGGRLVNVASIAGRIPALHGGYAESKYAMEAFTDIIRRKCKESGYRLKVCTIEPGFFATFIATKGNITGKAAFAWNRLSDEEKREFPESMLHKYIEKRMGAVNMIASRDTSKVTHAMEHALLSRWPRTRYSVGWDAKLLWIPLSYSPSWLQDLVVP